MHASVLTCASEASPDLPELNLSREERSTARVRCDTELHSFAIDGARARESLPLVGWRMAGLLLDPPCSPFAYAKLTASIEIYTIAQSSPVLYASEWRSDVSLHAALAGTPAVQQFLACMPLAAVLEACHHDFEVQLHRLLESVDVRAWLQ